MLLLQPAKRLYFLVSSLHHTLVSLSLECLTKLTYMFSIAANMVVTQ